jgi:hypothetical protein
MAKDNSKEIVGWGETALEDMSFQEMLDHGVIQIDSIDDTVQVDQSELVGKPFVLYEWEVKPSETFGGNYALIRVKTQDGTRVFADGGKGICEQLERYRSKLAKLDVDVFSPIYFPKGLRASSYVKTLTDASTGEIQKIPATTYYFDNSVD